MKGVDGRGEDLDVKKAVGDGLVWKLRRVMEAESVLGACFVASASESDGAGSINGRRRTNAIVDVVVSMKVLCFALCRRDELEG